MKPDVAVIGAGPGGLAVAVALHKLGISVQVYEQAQTLRPIGAGLSLAPNGLRTLATIDPDIVTALRACSSQIRYVNIWRSTGELMLRNQITYQELYGQPMLAMRWSSLQETLASFLPAACLHLNHRCTGLTPADQGVRIHFAHGLTLNPDLVIGADGIHSTVRTMLLADGPPRATGRLSWRAVLRYDHPLLQPDEAIVVIGPDRNFMIADAGEGFVFWSAAALAPDTASATASATIKNRALDMYAGWADPVTTIIAATPADRIVERPIYDRPPVATWSTGHATLLGDAAHPMVPALGQGANSAFEDAYELAHCLARATSVADALAAYEQTRVPRTQVIQMRSAFQGQAAYAQDNENFLRGVAERAMLGQDEFEQWLYAATNEHE